MSRGRSQLDDCSCARFGDQRKIGYWPSVQSTQARTRSSWGVPDSELHSVSQNALSVRRGSIDDASGNAGLASEDK